MTSACLALASAKIYSEACKVRTTMSAMLGVKAFATQEPKRKPTYLKGCFLKGILACCLWLGLSRVANH